MLSVCSGKEVMEIIASGAIIMEGIAMDAIKIISIDGRWKLWYLLDKPKAINKN
jgi:hypothetical protein